VSIYQCKHVWQWKKWSPIRDANHGPPRKEVSKMMVEWGVYIFSEKHQNHSCHYTTRIHHFLQFVQEFSWVPDCKTSKMKICFISWVLGFELSALHSPDRQSTIDPHPTHTPFLLSLTLQQDFAFRLRITWSVIIIFILPDNCNEKPAQLHQVFYGCRWCLTNLLLGLIPNLNHPNLPLQSSESPHLADFLSK
jgi:hypothetical protein